MSVSEAIASYIDNRRDAWLEELFEFLRIPSVSTDPGRKNDVAQAARWLAESLDDAGCQEVELWETPGNPVVFGAYWNGDPEARTVLVYGHYDVQPEDPVDKWDSPPFEPEIRDGKIWGRGTADDKGQLYVHVKALEAWLETREICPVNVKFMIEGEEEVGSEHIEKTVREHLDQLRCDALAISDTVMFADGLPSLCYGLRGLAYAQIDVTGPSGDLHSGSFGGAVMNPAEALARMLRDCKDPTTGKVALPGFYDDVVPLTEQERREWDELPFDRDAYRASVGASALAGEEGYGVLERLWARPTFEVNGLLSGFTGQGAKTVIPSTAMAKVSMRLVPDQDPDKALDALEAHLEDVAPEGISWELTRMHGGKPWLASRDHPVLQAAARALERGFGAGAVFIREGGSIPLVGMFDEILGVPAVLMGLGLPDENAHAPNENLDLDNFFSGIASAACFHEELSQT